MDGWICKLVYIELEGICLEGLGIVDYRDLSNGVTWFTCDKLLTHI